MTTDVYRIGNIRRMLTDHKKRAPTRDKRSPVERVYGTRNYRWHWDPAIYARVRAGRQFDGEMDLEETFRSGELREHMMSIFEHADVPERFDSAQPRFVGAFAVGDNEYVKAKQALLRCVYLADDRRDMERMQDVCADGTPYWVDVYAVRQMKTRENKRRHLEKKAKQR